MINLLKKEDFEDIAKQANLGTVNNVISTNLGNNNNQPTNLAQDHVAIFTTKNNQNITYIFNNSGLRFIISDTKEIVMDNHENILKYNLNIIKSILNLNKLFAEKLMKTPNAHEAKVKLDIDAFEKQMMLRNVLQQSKSTIKINGYKKRGKIQEAEYNDAKYKYEKALALNNIYSNYRKDLDTIELNSQGADEKN